MAKDVSVTLELAEGMHFIGANSAGLLTDLDSVAEAGGAGPSPMELVLMSLAGCSGMDVIAIMRKKRQDVRGLEVSAHGTRAEDYPRPYTAIRLEFRFTGAGLDPAACERSIELSRDRYCPIWAMLKASVEITYSFTVSEG